MTNDDVYYCISQIKKKESTGKKKLTFFYTSQSELYVMARRRDIKMELQSQQMCVK